MRPAGTLRQARFAHTATLLSDGRVLVVGGRGTDATTELASVELYDPLRRRWARAAPLSRGRAGHTATLLSDGRVLVVGGTGHDATGGAHRYVALATAEVYDPKANAWRPAAPLAEARNWHTATPLGDGRVLVVGGAREQRNHLASAELYDPKADAWTAAAPLPAPRCLHLALPLPGGVLVAGGRSNHAADGGGFGQPVATAALYDAASDAWTTLPALRDPRQFHAGVALPDGRALVVGGAAEGMLTNLAELWAPGGTEWALAEYSLSLSHAHHTATALPGGDVLVVGGETPEAVDDALAQRFDGKAQRWCVAGTLTASRKRHTATLLRDGRVLLVGGTSAGVPEPSVEAWEPAAGACVEPPGPSLSLDF